MVHNLDIYVRDKHGSSIQGAKVEFYEGEELLGTAYSQSGHATLNISGAPTNVGVKVFYKHIEESFTVAANQDNYEIQLNVKTTLDYADYFAILAGACAMGICLILVFSFSNRDDIQNYMLVALFALGGGAFATALPGFLNVDLKWEQRITIAAGGSLAVFVVLFFFVPAAAKNGVSSLPMTNQLTQPSPELDEERDE